MSDKQEDLELGFDVQPAAKKKAAKKRAAKKKAAKKKVAKKSSDEVDTSSKPAPVEDKKEDIPMTFSASPDDMDDYGDRSSRSEREAKEEATPSPQSEGGDKTGQAQASSNGQQQQQHRGRRHGGGDRQHGQHHNQKKKKAHSGHGQHGHGKPQNQNHPNQKKKKKPPQKGKGRNNRFSGMAATRDLGANPTFDSLIDWDIFKDQEALERIIENVSAPENEILDFNQVYSMSLAELEELAAQRGIEFQGHPNRKKFFRLILDHARTEKNPIVATGIVEVLEAGYGFLVFECDNYRIREESAFLNKHLIERSGIQRGHELKVLLSAPKENETCPCVLRIDSIMDRTAEEISHLTEFTELVPYYPLERMIMETTVENPKWDGFSMRIVDLLTPIGLGQRGLIVAPPRTGKTVLMQSMANAIRLNNPQAHLIILLIDERPEEVTDFRRQVEGAEIISSTFDESAESHVHAAEMVIERSRRMVEVGKDVVILLDSVTRLARAYNTTMPSSGKILSGGVEASALQKPKRFFGSARNIEGGGSLTILGTALVETGSKMDEVIFEEFKGTGNMELHLDRELSNKRVYPALDFDKSGTRKEELLYHPDEMLKVYALRRAMKGVPSTEAMEMLISRVKKTRNNTEFLLTLNR